MINLFSPTELRVLKLLGKKKLTVTKLTEEYFKKEKKPLNPNAVISSAVIRINRKCKYHKLNWFVNGCGGGRGGKEIWKGLL